MSAIASSRRMFDVSLFDGIRNGRTDLVDEYLQAGSATDCDEHGVPLIRWCAYHGDVSAVRRLLEHGERLESLGENLDLNGAVFHGYWQLVEYLIEQGADVNFALPDTHETALHAALCKSDRKFEPVVELLLSHGAEPNVATAVGVETGSFMRDVRTRGETPLHRAAAYASERTIDLVLAHGAEVEVEDANGDSPLTWASWHLRPAAILRKLCYGDFSIHPDAE